MAARGRFRDEAGGSAGPWLFAIAGHLLAQSVRGARSSVRRPSGSACSRGSTESRRRVSRPITWLGGLDEAVDDLPSRTSSTTACSRMRRWRDDAALFKDTAYETVDSTHHVNGGCRALNAAGTEWECYIERRRSGADGAVGWLVDVAFLGNSQG